MSTDSQRVARSLLPAGLWKSRYALNAVLATLVMTMMSACSDDEPQQQAERQVDRSARAIVVQIPAAQLPVQSMPPQYIAPPQQRAQPPVSDDSNPWAIRTTRPRGYGQHRSQQWGQPEPRQPQYTQPSSGSQYRLLEEPEPAATRSRAPVVQQPAPGYRPVAPYDRLSGSSFGTPAYPYGGAYPGYYGAPGGVYAPGWPGMGWPGYW